jgi:hypothetical protein
MEIEVVHLSKHGVWLSVCGEEVFLSFRDYPCFQKAPVGSIFNVQLLQGRHLRWPDLDVDLQLQQLPSSTETFPPPIGPVN